MFGMINDRHVNKAIMELLPLAENFYGRERMGLIKEGLDSFDVSLIDERSFENMLIKAGYDKSFVRCVQGFCGCSLNGESIYKYVVLSGIRNKKQLYCLLAHELFGHGVGIVCNVVNDNGYGYGPYRGFTYFDKINGKIRRKNLIWEEGFALYMEMNILHQMGIKCFGGYTFDNYLLAEKIFEVLFDKVPVLKNEILDSYVMKSKSLGEIFDGVMGDGYFDNLSSWMGKVDTSYDSSFVRYNNVIPEVEKLVRKLKK